MNENRFYVGVDVSKGYADFHVTNGSAQGARKLRLMDVPQGHDELRELLTGLLSDGQVSFGVEATGGYERNWLATASALRETCSRLSVYQVNPRSVQSYLESNLHRNVTDQLSALGIADYLRVCKPKAQYVAGLDDGLKALYRLACDVTRLAAKLKTQLIALLSSAAPELVCHTRSGMPDWLLRLLSTYGGAAEIAKALPADLAMYMPDDDSDVTMKLVSDAQKSVAALKDEAASLCVKHLARQLRDVQAMVDERKAEVMRLVRSRPEVQMLRSIPGIGEWTAAVLLLEVGDFSRFPTAEAITAYAGLDPKTHQSGDGMKRKRISRCGSARIRGAIFMPTLVAIVHNPLIRSFYERLVERGKPKKVALVAAMRKLLVMAWACTRTGVFNPNHEKARHKVPLASCRPSPPTAMDESAPVSRRAIKTHRAKNEAATKPQHAV